MSDVAANSKMLFIPEVEAFGGAERSVLAFSRWLHEHGIANHLLTYHDHIGLAKYAQHPLPVVALNPAGGGRAKVKALRTYLNGQHRVPQLLCSGYQPAMHATIAGARAFHTLMHDTPSLFSDGGRRNWKGSLRIGLSNKVVGYGLRSGGATVVTSEYLKSECRKDFGIDAKIARMGGLGSAEQFHERRVEGTLNLLSASRIEHNKRIDWMLNGLAALERSATPLSSRVDWHLRLAGKGSLLEPLRTRAAELGLADRVHFLGFVSDDELHGLYQSAHLFLMPAVQGYGIPAVESLQVGLPVLLHRESGVSDILRETPWATVIYGGEEAMVPALAQAIDGVIEGRQLGQPLPALQTEDEWAEQVARYCGWV